MWLSVSSFWKGLTRWKGIWDKNFVCSFGQTDYGGLIKKLVENHDILDVIVSSSLANKFQSLSRSASDGPSMCHIKLRRGWNGQNISATLALFLEMRADRTSKSIRSSSSPLTFSDTNFPMGSLTPLSASQINLPSSSSATLETYKVPFIKSL